MLLHAGDNLLAERLNDTSSISSGFAAPERFVIPSEDDVLQVGNSYGVLPSPRSPTLVSRVSAIEPLEFYLLVVNQLHNLADAEGTLYFVCGDGLAVEDDVPANRNVSVYQGWSTSSDPQTTFFHPILGGDLTLGWHREVGKDTREIADSRDSAWEIAGDSVREIADSTKTRLANELCLANPVERSVIFHR